VLNGGCLTVNRRERYMSRKIAKRGVAALVAVGGFAMAASPAMADPSYMCHYYQGEYVGATSIHTGVYFSPAQVTELGCNS
jgi:hypothetical protein